MDAVTFKLISIAVIFATGVGGGFFALRLGRSRRSAIFFSLGAAMAGGIFLGAGLIHMLPDAADRFSRLLSGLEYPLAFLLSTLGFVAILMIERILVPSGESELTEAGGQGSLNAYVLMLVLSVHSILAGIALGAEDRVVASAIILVAIVAHKGSAAFALVISLSRGGVERQRLLRTLVLFSLMTPFGVVIGSIFSALLTGRASEAFEAVFDSLAAGTFLYIAVLDIIREEFFDPENRWLKFLLLCVGLGLMAWLALFL